VASDFPAYIAQGHDHTRVRDYTPGIAAGEVMLPGDLWVFDTTNNWAERCGADPTLIAGISEVTSEQARLITASGKVPLRLFSGDNVVLGLASATTPAVSHIGDSYGITRESNGHWRLDVAKTTTSSRVRVIDVDIAAGIFFAVVHANLLQFADVEVATS
jgi:hypothetical protein